MRLTRGTVSARGGRSGDGHGAIDRRVWNLLLEVIACRVGSSGDLVAILNNKHLRGDLRRAINACIREKLDLEIYGQFTHGMGGGLAEDCGQL